MASLYGRYRWLDPLLAAFAPAGSHTAALVEARLGAQLNAEYLNPAGERDEQWERRVNALTVEYHGLQLANRQAEAAYLERMAFSFEAASARNCCTAAQWVQQRMAASYRARHDFMRQDVHMVTEQLAAARGRREAALEPLPTFQLHLPEALQQPPPRLDLCSSCAKLVDKADLDEQTCVLQDREIVELFQSGAFQQATASADPTGDGAAAAAPAAMAASHGGEAQQLQQQVCSGDGASAGGNGASTPCTPMQNAPTPQQHSSCSKQEQQAGGAAYELLEEKQSPPAQQQQQQQQQAELRASTVLFDACTT